VKASKRFYLLNRQRKHRLDTQGIRRFLSSLTEDMGKAEAFSVVFVTDKAMRQYNHRYRKLDKPTDVLSFPGEDGYLGDILVSTETAWKQAKQSRTLTFNDNIRRLLLHGVLHLSGYDHETDNGEMRAMERRLRRKFEC
jgi:probable rRNA maturation factor